MHPAQLSLLPDQVPAPAPTLLAQLPEQDVAEAIGLLGALIAKAAPIEETIQVAGVNADE